MAIFFEELKFNKGYRASTTTERKRDKKRVRLKNDADEVLMSAIIYVVGKTCRRILCPSEERRAV